MGSSHKSLSPRRTPAQRELQTPKGRKSSAKTDSSTKKVAGKSRQQAKSTQRSVPKELKDLKALVVSLDRRPDRWARCEAMLKKETPWLQYERFPASDGSKMTIPESEV